MLQQALFRAEGSNLEGGLREAMAPLVQSITKHPIALEATGGAAQPAGARAPGPAQSAGYPKDANGRHAQQPGRPG